MAEDAMFAKPTPVDKPMIVTSTGSVHTQYSTGHLHLTYRLPSTNQPLGAHAGIKPGG